MSETPSGNVLAIGSQRLTENYKITFPAAAPINNTNPLLQISPNGDISYFGLSEVALPGSLEVNGGFIAKGANLIGDEGLTAVKATLSGDDGLTAKKSTLDEVVLNDKSLKYGNDPAEDAVYRNVQISQNGYLREIQSPIKLRSVVAAAPSIGSQYSAESIYKAPQAANPVDHYQTSNFIDMNPFTGETSSSNSGRTRFLSKIIWSYTHNAEMQANFAFSRSKPFSLRLDDVFSNYSSSNINSAGVGGSSIQLFPRDDGGIRSPDNLASIRFSLLVRKADTQRTGFLGRAPRNIRTAASANYLNYVPFVNPIINVIDNFKTKTFDFSLEADEVLTDGGFMLEIAVWRQNVGTQTGSPNSSYIQYGLVRPSDFGGSSTLADGTYPIVEISQS